MPKGIGLLRRALKLSGLPQQKFAETYLAHSPRTMKRWLAGGSIPSNAIAQLRRVLATLELDHKLGRDGAGR